MMKKLLLLAFMFPLLQFVQAQEEIVKWTFPNNTLSDTIQNGTNSLNLTATLRIEGAGPVTMTNGATNKAATATNWNNGMNIKNWNIRFLTTGYGQVKISSKQSAGGTNGGPVDFKIQYKIGSSGTWADVRTDTVKLANNWSSGIISNLDLPAECQNQSDLVYIRWIMISDKDINIGSVTPTGISKIDDILVTGMLLTSVADQNASKRLSTFPNPSTSSFTIDMAIQTTLVEVYNTNGQLVYKTNPGNEILTVEKKLPAGMYFIKATQDGKVKIIKHIVR